MTDSSRSSDAAGDQRSDTGTGSKTPRPVQQLSPRAAWALCLLTGLQAVAWTGMTLTDLGGGKPADQLWLHALLAVMNVAVFPYYLVYLWRLKHPSPIEGGHRRKGHSR